MNVKYQIFVSSTYEDLKDERNEVIKACLNMGHIPVGMEMFNAADEEQWAVITRTIDQCDYYVVIIAHRYGSTVDDISFTEKEYDYAVEQSVPVLGFVIEDGASWPNDRIDKDQAAVEALRAFKSKVKQRMVRFWRDKSELQAHFAMSLNTYININPRRGWVRAPDTGGADVAQALSNLTAENSRLRSELQSVATVRGDSDTILAALRQYKIRKQNRDDVAKQVRGDYILPAFARAVERSPFDPLKSVMQECPWLESEDAYNFFEILLLMGVLSKGPVGSQYYLKTPLCGVIYAKLMLKAD